MGYLIYSTYEVGGLPFKFAKILKAHGVDIYYISRNGDSNSHDSKLFHHGQKHEAWDITEEYKELSSKNGEAKALKSLATKHKIASAFATGKDSYLLGEANIPYLYWSYGADIDPLQRTLLRYLLAFELGKVKAYLYQKYKAAETEKTIHSAAKVAISRYQLNTLLKYGKKPLFFFPHIVHTQSAAELQKTKQDAKQMFFDKHGTRDYFFSSVRHMWVKEASTVNDHKGNNVAIHCFAKFLSSGGSQNTRLVFIEKGADVYASKQLISSLGIADKAVWLKEMPRKELDSLYAGAICCFGQFGVPLLVGAIVEALGFGTPVISWIEADDKKVPWYSSMPPIFSSKNQDDIAAEMLKLSTSNSYKEEVGMASFNWTKHNCAEKIFVNSIVDNLKSISF